MTDIIYILQYSGIKYILAHDLGGCLRYIDLDKRSCYYFSNYEGSPEASWDIFRSDKSHLYDTIRALSVLELLTTWAKNCKDKIT